MKELAIIGSTASGKSDLAIKVALKKDAYILSLDSLSIYKQIDIASAKPSKQDLAKVPHFGVDLISVDEHFSVQNFIDLYRQTKQICLRDSKDLIIVGGTSFYLKSLLDGLSPLPVVSKEVEQKASIAMQDQRSAYESLYALDPLYMSKIASNDTYRTHKSLLIYYASGVTPSEWFRANPPKPIIKDLAIYNISTERDLLRSRIEKRTTNMLEDGLIDEVKELEKRYGVEPKPMKSIGIKETLEYLSGEIDLSELHTLISTHTAQLAKRQRTFNRSAFKDAMTAPLEELREVLLS